MAGIDFGSIAVSYPYRRILAGVCIAIVAACAAQRDSHGSTHTHRSQLAPEAAARCFARNAEEHSIALKSEVSGANVTVRVKNGVTYATAAYRRSGSGSVGTIDLNVTRSGRRNDLFDSLVEGC